MKTVDILSHQRELIESFLHLGQCKMGRVGIFRGDQLAPPVVPPVADPAPRQARPKPIKDASRTETEPAVVDIVWTR